MLQKTLSHEKSQHIFNRAMKVLPKGVSSNFRYWGPKETPVLVRSKGCRIWDADGNEFIDYRLGWGPIILGHADDRVNQAVHTAIDEGTTFAATSDLEVQVAEKIVAMIPGLDMLRFTNTGTEATMHALRVARAYTGREKILKFEGHYHGMHDYLLFSTAGVPIDAMGNRRNPIPVPNGSGIPRGMQDYLITVPFNDFELIERTIEDHYWEIAAMIVEPGMGNVAAVEALPGYLEHLRKLCDEYGIVLIFDEVKTGFRLSNSGAREVYGVTPDLSTYAKSLGNGYPVAAFGGKQAIMEIIGPNSVAHGGTFSANKLSLAAANAVLDVLTDSPVLAKMAQRGHRLRSGLSEILSDASIPHQMSGHPNMPGILFTEKPITEYRHMVYHNEELYGQVLHNLYTLGVWAEDDAREPWFLCEAHTDEIIDQTLNKFEEAVKATVS